MVDRLADIQKELAGWYEQLSGEERAFRLAEEADKTRLRQKIDLTQERIRAVEEEYAQRLSQQIKRQDLPEPMAETVVAELVDEIELLEVRSKDDGMTALLQQILAELQKPATPASAKLKVAIPLIPNVVTYEIEGDTEGVLRQLFPTFTRLYEGTRAQLPGGQAEKK